MDGSVVMTVIMISIPDETYETIKANAGEISPIQMAANIIWQAARDKRILTRARDMVSQPWEEYDNESYE